MRPHLAIVVPGLILDVAGKELHQAADGIRRLLNDWVVNRKRRQRIGGVPYAVREIKQRIDKTSHIVTASQLVVFVALSSGHKRECFWNLCDFEGR